MPTTFEICTSQLTYNVFDNIISHELNDFGRWLSDLGSSPISQLQLLYNTIYNTKKEVLEAPFPTVGICDKDTETVLSTHCSSSD